METQPEPGEARLTVGHGREDCTGLSVGRLSPKQPLDQLLSAQGEVLGHVAEETGQRPNPEG
jgi:hypothetical protein